MEKFRRVRNRRATSLENLPQLLFFFPAMTNLDGSTPLKLLFPSTVSLFFAPSRSLFRALFSPSLFRHHPRVSRFRFLRAQRKHFTTKLRGRFYPSAQPNRPSGTSLSLSHSCSIFGTRRLFQKADPLVQQCLTPGNAIFAGAIYSRLERLVCKSQIASCSFPHALITGSGFERARTLPAREREGKVFRAAFLE